MGDVIAPSEYEKLIFQVVHVGQKSIKLTRYIGNDTDTLFFGGHVKYCIDALIQKPGSKFEERGLDISDAFLSHLYYDMTCSLQKNFKRGIDSVMILKLCISYIKDTYPHIKTVSFTDSSTKACDDGKVVELSEMNYVRTGKTWYQTHFHAYMEPIDERKFTICEKRFQTAKQTMTWRELKAYMIGVLPMEELEMKRMFEASSSWQDFFGAVSDKIGISAFCSFVAPWLHRFIENEMRFYFSSTRYFIPVDKIEYISYKTDEYITGGRRYTHKNRRKYPRNEH